VQLLTLAATRSGSSLRQLMLEHADPRARCFAGEVPGHRAAMQSRRNYALLICKQPGDMFRWHLLQNYYAKRSAELRPLVMIRDPRDVLTSHHANQPGREYFRDGENWCLYDDFVRRHQSSHGLFRLRYADWVTDVETLPNRLEAFSGEPILQPLSGFHTAVRGDFRELPALNGLRSVDTNSAGRWRDPKRRDRIPRILNAHPSIAQRLIAWGYEPDES